MLTSILEIDLSKSLIQSYREILKSPRTLEAMANLGILAEELDDKSYDLIKKELIKRERK